jgi:hypothetical protein
LRKVNIWDRSHILEALSEGSITDIGFIHQS